VALREHEISMLAKFLPANTAEEVIDYMHSHKIHLSIKKERRRILGDYRPAHNGKPHRISINGNLNEYHFLITFLHELAHLLTFLNHQGRVNPHGQEWKNIFKILLKRFQDKKVFPEDVEFALDKSMNNLAASTCSDPYLYKVLHKYDHKKDVFLVEQIAIGDTFKTDKGQVFKMVEKRRTRYLCEEVKTGKRYLFPSIYEVSKL
jgi:hypothetical protein